MKTEPMPYEQALAWLVSGDSPAGTLVSDTRARKLLGWAMDAGVVHLTRGSDFKAPGYLLSYDGTLFHVHPSPPRATTPGAVGDTLRAFGFQMAGRGNPGWTTMWAGDDAVRVQNRAVGVRDLKPAREELERSGWTVEAVVELSVTWLRVTQEPARAVHPGQELPRPAGDEVTWVTGNLTTEQERPS